MDYVLAAHIRVVGGPEAIAQIQQLDQAIGRLGTSGGQGGEQAGQNVAKGLGAAKEQAGLMERAIGQAGIALTRIATYQGVSLLASGIKDAVTGWLDFDQAMTNSLSIQHGVTDSMRGEMEGLAQSISVNLGMAPKDVAEGFYFLASAGLDVNQQLADLPVVAEFAKAGMMSIEGASEMLLDSLSALGMKVDDPMKQMQNLQRLSDVLVQAANASQGTIEQFGTALTHKAAASMVGLNIPLEQGVGLLEVFAERGLKGASAGERFSMVVRDMGFKARAHSEEWEKVGVHVFDANGQFRKLTEIMPEVDRALLPLSSADRMATLKAMGFTMRDMNTIMGLLGTSGRLQFFVDDQTNVGHVAKEVADKQMESLRAKLDQLKSFVMVMEIKGLDAIQAAGEWLAHTFAPALNEIIDFLGHLAAGAAPVAEAFARLAVGAVAATLQAIAGALNAIFGAINAHPGLVEGLGTALASIAVVGVVSKLSELAVVIGSNLMGAIRNITTPLLGFIGNLAAIQASEGTFAALKAGIAGLVEMAGPLTVMGVAIAGIAVAFTTFRQGEQAAKDLRAEIEKKYDTSTLEGMQSAATVLTQNFEDFREAHHQSFLGMMNDTGNWLATFGKVGENYFKTAGQIKEMREQAIGSQQDLAQTHLSFGLLAQAFGVLKPNMEDFSQEFKNAGLNMDALPIGQLREQLRGMVGDTKFAGGGINQFAADFERVARDFHIDFKGLTPEETVEQTLRIGSILTKMYALHDATRGLGGAAEGVGANLSSVEKAIATMGDAGSNAEDKLKALKAIMDEINGVPLNLFEAETGYGKSLQDLRETLRGVTADFDSNTAAGSKQREALSGAAESAIKFAQAQAHSTGNVRDGIEYLSAYADQIGETMRSAGIAEPVVAEYLRKLGLAPEQIQTLFHTVIDPDPSETKKQLDNAAAPRTALISTSAQNADKTEDELKKIGRQREVAYNAIAHAGTVPDDLAFLARNRQAIIDAFAHPGTSEEDLNHLSRLREALIQAKTSGVEEAARILDEIGRDRTANVYVQVHAADVAGQRQYVENAADGGIFDGRGVKSYAMGGFENHAAMIASAGPIRMWAEPETGGEAYIPLGSNKRDRSLAIWADVGRRFGMMDGSPSAVVSKSVGVSINAPVNVAIDGGGMSAPEVAALVGQQVSRAQHAFATKLLVELRSR